MLVERLGLQRWVTAGTVHTFQGNECDVIIFDSVLAEPSWTARLTNPHEHDAVVRDLNVAVTRARHQFVFVGDGAWLDRHASKGSGYGSLWRFLRGHVKQGGGLLQAEEVLGRELRSRVAASTSEAVGWGNVALPSGMTLLDETTFYPAFITDLGNATDSVILFTPFFGKVRWPLVEPHVTSLPARGVKTTVLHKPLTDAAWRSGDPAFGQEVVASLDAAGAHRIELQGVHAKTIVIDGHLVYDGSLNWASQRESYEHMWRMQSRDAAAVVERLLQLDRVAAAAEDGDRALRCPYCGGALQIVNQRETRGRAYRDQQALKLACTTNARDKNACRGYIRGLHVRAPFEERPICPRGEPMELIYNHANAKPSIWKCSHKGCRSERWRAGDFEA
jgi:hypothetical protein